MKQKRKVKSLLPYKINKDGTMLTVLLLILSLVLCLGSASLMTVSVGAADTKMNDYAMVYPGIDDNTEVLYGLQFSDRNRLWDELVNQFFMKNKTLYISPNQVKVKSEDSSFVDNTIDTGKYINVLGGENNEVKSDNITIIAGNGDKVESGNDNASILGGELNKIKGVSSGSPAVIAGGYENTIEGKDSNVIIGGNNNIIKNAESTVILGGESNTVNGGKNIIVGGSNVEVDGVDNVFVYSNSSDDFKPKSSNAFYLNLSDGVGINADAAKGGLFVSGAVGFGEIDINKTCDDNNIGVIGNWQGCLVGCTEASRPKWELLDRGVECEKKCTGGTNCSFSQVNYEKENQDYTGFCTDHVSTENATRCTTGENEYYKDVVFQTVLIDFNQECPVSGDNKCVYRCNPGSHLTGNIAGGDSSTVMCYKDCPLPWDESQVKKHNETIIGYNIEDVSCSNNEYKFPFKIKPWVSSGKSPETCGNYNHKKTLICNQGYWYIMKNGKADLSTKALAESYKYENCFLDGYRCNTGDYELVKEDIERKNDKPKNNGSRVGSDRSTLTFERGQYKLCIDYNAAPETNLGSSVKNGETCVTGSVEPTAYHYHFSGCNKGYDLMDGKCMKQCTLTGSNGKTKVYSHGTSVTGYKASEVTCTDTCQAKKITCNDGTWELGNGASTTDYKYEDCKLYDKVCSGYDVDQLTQDQHKSVSIYDPCDRYNANGLFSCEKSETKYKLVNCVSGNHTEPEHESWMKWCISNEKTVNCLTGNGDPQKYEYFITGVKVTWSGSRNSGSWSTPKACEWKCKEGNHLSGEYNNGGECVSNKKNVPCKTGWAEGHWDYIQVDVEIIWTGGWNTGHWSEPDKCELSGCAPGWCPVGTCGSQTEEVLCTSNPNMPTTGAHEINTGEFYTVSCGEKRYCDWVCDMGRHLEDGLCVPNTKKECVETGTLPEFAYFDHTKFDRVWQGEWNTGHWSEIKPCPMNCTSGYDIHRINEPEGIFECVEIPGCQGDLNSFRNTEIVNSGDDTLTDPNWTIYSSREEASGHTCSLVCDESHIFIDGKCKRCPNGIASDQCLEEPKCGIDLTGIIVSTDNYLNNYSTINCKQYGGGLTGAGFSNGVGLTGVGSSTQEFPYLLLIGAGVNCANVDRWKFWFDSTGKSLLSYYDPSSLVFSQISKDNKNEWLVDDFDLNMNKRMLETLLSGAGVLFLLYPKVNCVLETNGDFNCSCVYYGDCLGANGKPLNLAGSEGVLVYGNTYDENRPIGGEGESKKWSYVISKEKLKPNNCTFTCASQYVRNGYGCTGRTESTLSCSYLNHVRGYVNINRGPPINFDSSWTMFNDTTVDYGPYDSGEKLIFEDGRYCSTASGTSCYDLSGMGCAWACEPHTTLAKKVTFYAYNNDSYNFYCRKKCADGRYYDGAGKCVLCSPQMTPDTGLIIGPVNGVGVVLTGSDISKGNPVRCVRRCGNYENYNSSTKECEKVNCTGPTSYVQYVYDEYRCFVCEIDKGYELTGWDNEYKVYTECTYKCKSWERWDNINKVCYVEQCDEDEYMDDYGNCNTCPEGQKPAGKDDNRGGNYTECENICANDETYYMGKCLKCENSDYVLRNGVCISKSGVQVCPVGTYRKKDDNGNFVEPMECFSCHVDEYFDEESWQCVDKNS